MLWKWKSVGALVLVALFLSEPSQARILRRAGLFAARGLSFVLPGRRARARRAFVRRGGMGRPNRIVVNRSFFPQSAALGQRHAFVPFFSRDSFFDPGVGLLGRGFHDPGVIADPRAVRAFSPFDRSFDDSVDLDLDGLADDGDQCGVQLNRRSIQAGRVVVRGVFFDRNRNQCITARVVATSNPFPFSNVEDCETAVISGACRFSRVRGSF